ncbi:MAG: glycosyltransferase [Gloeobacteraceae cyanobacterium ES-bin-316]|nr:glycosyltransferase [Ferruginibacter sp.]
MIRICTSLAIAGYAVTLIGRKNKKKEALIPRIFQQKRLTIFAHQGPLFYIEYNIRLFFYLLFNKFDCICAIDLDTILPVYACSFLRRKKKIYDAHEYFSQLKEVISRKKVYAVWHKIERSIVPKFKYGYTVSKSIADEFERLYGVKYETIRNMPEKAASVGKPVGKNIIYQGAVNEGRGFEFLIPAMKDVAANLLVYGDGNFIDSAKEIVAQAGLTNKILFKGMLLPEELSKATSEGYIGVNLVENIGLNQYFSLANKFFDYIQCAIPQVTMNFPEYRSINEKYNVALLINDLHPSTISDTLNKILHDDVLYSQIKTNCNIAAKDLNWQKEEQKLIAFYKKILG